MPHEFVRAEAGHSRIFDDAERERRPLGGRTKRALDLALASALLVLAAPIMLVVSALVRICIGGPVVTAQPRIGFNGEVFACYKFRAMAANHAVLPGRHLAANPKTALEWREPGKLRDDPRASHLGRALRTSSLDELPQLFNVLRGDMSLVGPRPVVPDELGCYGRHARFYVRARPGLTGLRRPQTGGRNRAGYPGCVARDRYYVRHWSLWLDLVLLIKTVSALLKTD